MEDSFAPLFPRDGSADAFGRFPCGRYSETYETKEFGFPRNLSCDRCTVQLIWATPDFTHYHCSDVTLMTDKVKLCMGKCKNGGTCSNGRCICQDMYYGTHCEHKRTSALIL